jgi:cell division protein FtsB
VRISGSAVRLTGRLALTALILGVVVLVVMQFEGIVVKNVALASQLSASRERIAVLQAREGQQRRTIARLENPLGAVPEIHDELRLVGPNEEIIYLRGAADDRSQTPREWDESQ